MEVRSVQSDGTVDRMVATAELDAHAATRHALTTASQDLAAGRTPPRSVLNALTHGLGHSLRNVAVQSDQLRAATLGCSASGSVGDGPTLGGGGAAQIVNLRHESRGVGGT
jgi:hypothetical protein